MELLFVFGLIFLVYVAAWGWREAARAIGLPTDDEATPGRRRRVGGRDLADLRRLFQRFAQSRDGQVYDRAPLEPPRAGYLFRTARAMLSIYESPHEPREAGTQLSFTIPPGFSWRCEIFPAAEPGPGVPVAGGVRTGDAAFDEAFILKTDDARFAREFLDAPTRQAIADLRLLLANGHILVSLHSTRLLVRKRGILAGWNELDLFGRLGDQIYDRLHTLWQKASGIEILEGAPPENAADPVCSICGHAVDGRGRVECRRCRTPYHADCWSFNDGCATYACGEKNVLRVH